MAAPEEYALVRSRVGLLDRGDFGVLELTGRDRTTFLHALVSNEIKALGPGQGCAATLLDVHGKVQVILFVWVADDRIFVVTPPAMAARPPRRSITISSPRRWQSRTSRASTRSSFWPAPRRGRRPSGSPARSRPRRRGLTSRRSSATRRCGS